ncbi:peptidylprolyl isomerase [Aquimarina sp. D1M17]|uniref:peptidylprolyl isomerase n=1 Tax=Aquimarina acroporae TaxID=2937283 RepID=UPI0020BF0F68|nr:peptidylprolyl isomerase [Aquimarina acroporae]MCK8522739.1 peptidylprolyl isomerase [Aquimarina acroporae]
MRKKSFLFFLGLILFGFINAQHTNEVLLTIDDTPVYTSEFKTVYLKNIDLVQDNSQKDIDEYLNLFINYKLKLKEAKFLGLDKKDSYLQELKGYKKQLVSGYLTDTQASEALLKEAYERSLKRVNASHILVMLRPNSSPKDTIAAYEKIVEAREKIMGGEKFEDVAKLYSQDPSVAQNGGNLGWFSVFRMVYPFENAAYNTKVGEVSQPFKTQFGYHIIKVQEREQRLGEVTVAHIMIAVKENRSKEDAKERILEIKQQLNLGASFSSLAKQYSDDPSTAVDGGRIRRFGQGALNSEKFEDAAFGLKKEGQLSDPIETKYGWHIIKLIEKHPLQTFEEQKNALTNRVKRDNRSKLVTESFMNKLKEKYALKENEEAIAYFIAKVPDSISEENWSDLEDNYKNKELFSIKKEKYIYKDFAEYLYNRLLRVGSTVNASVFVNQTYKQFESKTLLKYYENHLEEDNEDYARVIKEYREGLLLFDLMESKIWNASKLDSTGLLEFYESRKKEKYTQEETYKVIKASSSSDAAIKEVQKLFEQGKGIKEIKENVNKGDAIRVLFTEEELIAGGNKLPNGFSSKEGDVTIVTEDNFVTLIKVEEILPARVKAFDEIKGEVINDFQTSMEDNWISQLKTKYPVEVNKKVLKKVKKDLSI